MHNKNALEQDTNSGEKGFPFIPVNSLIDVICFNYCDKNKFEEIIRAWCTIKHVKYCKVEVCEKNVITCKEERQWIINITLKLIICYETISGREYIMERFVFFKKFVPFPPCEKHDEFIDYSKLMMKLIIEKADCTCVKIKYIDNHLYIIADLELDYKLWGTEKKNLPVLVYKPKC